jgi:hypothetical protein
MRLGLFTYSQAISRCSGNVAPRVLGAYNGWQGKKRQLDVFLGRVSTEIKRALPTDADDFAALVLISSPSLFPAIYGDGVRSIMQHLFDYMISSPRMSMR